MDRAKAQTDLPRRPTSVTTFYYGACPVCDREIANYRRAAAGHRELLWRDVDSCPDALACFGVDTREARRRLHVIDRNGVLQSGVDAFIAIWRELPGYRWLAWLVGIPGLHGLAGLVYDHMLVPALQSWNTHRAAGAA
ncbi:MAG: DUF393 domain-containing protein [Alphaproteobacteria bacterium]|nr:DUF393 domain-containing protein [Alphaproteobacteria bacterium]